MAIREDQNRFKSIIKGRVREDFKKYVTNGELIGKREAEFVKIPIPRIDIPTFRYGPKQNEQGVGQGDGEGQASGQPGQGQKGQGQGEAGESPGEHLVEVEISLEELADILGEKLELPRILPKGTHQLMTEKNRYSGIAPVGPEGLRKFKQTYKKALARYISSGIYNPLDPVIIPIRSDYQYRTVKKTQKPHTKAVVIYMMDVSGSMGDEQKEIVRLESFWINTWLKKHYKGLDTRFIIHDAAAKEVDEETFFKTSESGGTLISSAYKLAQQIIEEEYPVNEWNIYPFHFSDGDNWSGEDTRLCVDLIRDYFLPRVNVFSYGQVESKYGSGQFLKDLQKEFADNDNMTLSQIESRDKILDSIKDFLGKGK